MAENFDQGSHDDKPVMVSSWLCQIHVSGDMHSGRAYLTVPAHTH